MMSASSKASVVSGLLGGLFLQHAGPIDTHARQGIMHETPASCEVMSATKSEPHACRYVSHGEHGGTVNYYPFHLGDYASHTAHLSPMEDLAYRRMLDLYYRTEKPLPSSCEDISRLIRLTDNAATVRDVLNEFFMPCDDGWHHTRCDEELSRMKDKQAKAKASAAASVAVRLANAQRTLNERSTKVELPTPTPTPTLVDTAHDAKASSTKRGSRLPEDWVLPKAWGEWALAEFPEWTPGTVRLEASKFADFWHAKAGRDAAKLDWCATWRNWCRNSTPSKATQAATVTHNPQIDATKAYLQSQTLTPEELAASNEARRRALSAIKVRA